MEFSLLDGMTGTILKSVVPELYIFLVLYWRLVRDSLMDGNGSWLLFLMEQRMLSALAPVLSVSC